MMKNLETFLKYNPEMIHINLSNTGMITSAIHYLSHPLKRAQSLRSIHLDGNPGVNNRSIDFLIKEIKAVDPFM